MQIITSEHALRIHNRIRSTNNLSELEKVSDKWIKPVVDLYDAISGDPAVEYPDELRFVLQICDDQFNNLTP